MPELFHVSEAPDINLFAPRPSKYTDDKVVWGITADKLVNYLLPRDCPRVTFFAAATTTRPDRDSFLRGTERVVALEQGWYKRLVACELYVYALPAAGFRLHDENAGYWVSPDTVRPSSVAHIPDLMAALFAHRVELRFLPTLWPLADAVAASSLGFSIIRMRNAAPRLA